MKNRHNRSETRINIDMNMYFDQSLVLKKNKLMKTLWAIIKKEMLLLSRDMTGLALLFLMPVAMVFLMTMLQDSTIKALQNERLDVIVLDMDSSIVGKAILTALDSASVFNTHTGFSGKNLNREKVLNLIEKGKVNIGLVIPTGATKRIRRVISAEIKKQMPTNTLLPSGTRVKNIPVEVEIYFDPVMKASLKQALTGSLEAIMAKVQTRMVFRAYSRAIQRLNGRENNDEYPIRQFVLKEKPVGRHAEARLPNSTEHNVPAWTIFAIFFIVIPMSGQMIAERTEGPLRRLKTMPVPYSFHLTAKILVFSFIAILQVGILLLIGHFILPMLRMPVLHINHLTDILAFTFFIGLAASSYAVAIGTIARTQHQAAIFGSISVVILAAIGGIWVPLFMMSDTMIRISGLSPLNWSLQGYSVLFLQNGRLTDIIPEIIKLLAFSGLSLIIAVLFEKKYKN